MADDLSLNSLDRFQKRSAQLVHVAVSGEVTLWIDGRPCPSGRMLLPFGEHVLGIYVRRLTGLATPFLFAGLRDTAACPWPASPWTAT